MCPPMEPAGSSLSLLARSTVFAIIAVVFSSTLIQGSVHDTNCSLDTQRTKQCAIPASDQTVDGHESRYLQQDICGDASNAVTASAGTAACQSGRSQQQQREQHIGHERNSQLPASSFSNLNNSQSHLYDRFSKDRSDQEIRLVSAQWQLPPAVAFTSDLGLMAAPFLLQLATAILPLPATYRTAQTSAQQDNLSQQQGDHTVVAIGQCQPWWPTAVQLVSVITEVLLALGSRLGSLGIQSCSDQYLFLQPWGTLWLCAAVVLLSQAKPLHKFNSFISHGMVVAWLLTLDSTSSSYAGDLLGHFSTLLLLRLLLTYLVPCTADRGVNSGKTTNSSSSHLATTPHAEYTSAVAGSGRTADYVDYPSSRSSSKDIITTCSAAAAGAAYRNSPAGDEQYIHQEYHSNCDAGSPPPATVTAAINITAAASSTPGVAIVAALSPAPSSHGTSSAVTPALSAQHPELAVAVVQQGPAARLASSSSSSTAGHAANTVLPTAGAMAACAQGVVVGAKDRSVLYTLPVHHHLVSVKVPANSSRAGHEFVSCLAHHLQHTAAAQAAATAAPAPSVLLMNSPLVVRGCFHILLSIAAPAAAQDLFQMPLNKLISQLPAGSRVQAMSQQGTCEAAACGGGGGDSDGSVDSVLLVQINQQEPVMVMKQLAGSWKIRDNASATTAAGAAPANSSYGSSAVTADGGSSSDGQACWLQSPCLMLPGSTAPLSAVEGYSSSSRSGVEVVMQGIPAAAGRAVRAVLVQGPKILTDMVVQLRQQDARVPSNMAGSSSADTGLSARVVLPAHELLPGPALMYLLTPSAHHSTSTFHTPAGSAAAAVTAHNATGDVAGVGSARVWACVPILLVQSEAAAAEFNKLFRDMCTEVQQQQALGQLEKLQLNQAHSSLSAAAEACTSGGASGSSSGSSNVEAQVSQQYWQAMLWDWHYAAHATDVSCVNSTAAVIDVLCREPTRTAADVTNIPVSAGGRAVQQPRPAAATAVGEGGGKAALTAARQQLANEVLSLLRQRGLHQAAQEVKQQLAAPISGNGSGLDPSAAAGAAGSTATALIGVTRLGSSSSNSGRTTGGSSASLSFQASSSGASSAATATLVPGDLHIPHVSTAECAPDTRAATSQSSSQSSMSLSSATPSMITSQCDTLASDAALLGDVSRLLGPPEYSSEGSGPLGGTAATAADAGQGGSRCALQMPTPSTHLQRTSSMEQQQPALSWQSQKDLSSLPRSSFSIIHTAGPEPEATDYSSEDVAISRRGSHAFSTPAGLPTPASALSSAAQTAVPPSAAAAAAAGACSPGGSLQDHMNLLGLTSPIRSSNMHQMQPGSLAAGSISGSSSWGRYQLGEFDMPDNMPRRSFDLRTNLTNMQRRSADIPRHSPAAAPSASAVLQAAIPPPTAAVARHGSMRMAPDLPPSAAAANSSSDYVAQPDSISTSIWRIMPVTAAGSTLSSNNAAAFSQDLSPFTANKAAAEEAHNTSAQQDSAELGYTSTHAATAMPGHSGPQQVSQQQFYGDSSGHVYPNSSTPATAGLTAAVECSASGMSAAESGDQRWHVFSTDDMEGYGTPDQFAAANLTSSHHSTAANSTTWFAIPTNSAANMLPPTPSHRSGALYHHSTARTPGPSARKLRTPSHYSSSGYFGGPSGLNPGVFSRDNLSGHPSQPIHTAPGSVSTLLTPQQRASTAGSTAPGHSRTPNTVGRVAASHAGSAAPATSAAGYGSSSGAHLTPSISKGPSAGQRKLMLFSPVRNTGAAAARRASDTSKRWGSLGMQQQQASTTGSCNILQTAALLGHATTTAPTATDSITQGLLNMGLGASGPSTSSSKPLAATAGPGASISGNNVLSAAALPPVGMRRVPSRGSLANTPQFDGIMTPARPPLPSATPADYRTPQRVVTPAAGSTPRRVPGSTPGWNSQQQLTTPKAAPGMFESWATNLATPKNKNRATVSGVLELLSGQNAGVDGGSSASAALRSSQLSPDSDDESSVPAYARAAATPGGGGYFTPMRTVRPQTHLPAAGSMSASRPAVLAAAAAGTTSRRGLSSGPYAGASPHMFGGLDRSVSALSRIPSSQFGEPDEDDICSPVAQAGRQISGALFAPDGDSLAAGLGLTGMSNVLSRGNLVSMSAQPVHWQPAAGPAEAAEGSAFITPTNSGGSNVVNSEQQQQHLQMFPANAPLFVAIPEGGVSTGWGDDGSTPVQTPPAGSPAGTPPDQIMYSLDNGIQPALGCMSYTSPPAAALLRDLGAPDHVQCASVRPHRHSSPGALTHRSPQPGHLGEQHRAKSSPCISNLAARQVEVVPMGQDVGSPAVVAAAGGGGRARRASAPAVTPPPAPARPLPSVMLVPACEAVMSEALFSEEYYDQEWLGGHE